MTEPIASAAWVAIAQSGERTEASCVEEASARLAVQTGSIPAIEACARSWIDTLREHGPRPLGLESLLLEYRLDTREGIALMCLAEALLRIADPDEADALIHDLLGQADWRRHLGHSDDVFINAVSRGLALTGRWLGATEYPLGKPQHWLRQLADRLGDPVLRSALHRAVRFLAGQFVLGESLDAALQRVEQDWRRGISHSFDMLGEAALTEADSTRYRSAYRTAIVRVGSCTPPPGTPRPGVSIKLSALHPRYCIRQHDLLKRELLPELCALVALAAQQQVEISIDAEEADRLELSLHVFAALLARLPATQRRHVGIVVQAYNKRALAVLNWLREIASHYDIRLQVRLVKGAYWDTEIKRAQQRGLPGYPVFTDKHATDINYLACAEFLFAHRAQFFPQFATHNAVTIAALLDLAGAAEFELQRLQGMGDALHECVHTQHPHLQYRIYAPIGEHRELLPYLVRRLLENGANTSFIHQLFDPAIATGQLAQHPLRAFSDSDQRDALPLPADLFQPERINSPGIDLYNGRQRDTLFAAVRAHFPRAESLAPPAANMQPAINPATGECIGHWRETAAGQVQTAMLHARTAQKLWRDTDVTVRAAIAERIGEQFIAHRAELVGLLVAETGRTLDNALEEVREAVDFCRYYAASARTLLARPQTLPATTGERNRLWLRPRGIFACISPWNFPLAIFTGQIVAALVTGNSVLAKPAEQATLTAMRATQLMHAAGVPPDVLQLLAGRGETVGAALCAQENLNGIVFTGGVDTAHAIRRQLAQCKGALIPLIAETAGLNCLIADGSAQPQQLVQDVLRSAFDSAGQRCSALRVLLLPDSDADAIETLLIGALQTLRIGDPADWSTDIGPLIDADAQRELNAHIEHFRGQGRVIFEGDQLAHAGFFVPPTLIRLQRLDELSREAFGPVLHILRYDPHELDAIIDAINASGYGLTCGIHSRNQTRAHAIASRLDVGNVYINRDMIGAAVGAQPFGGCGRSGTGPKAGGPNYLRAFVTEQTITDNTAAIGGDVMLMSSPPDRSEI
jgi:RHH-type proline utilization regulon transcriptional repressor/proline dehydrogenase/delta 1-pyrroline-5-carboxylate dehydrogenase